MRAPLGCVVAVCGVLAAAPAIAGTSTITFDTFSPQSSCLAPVTTDGLSFANGFCVGVWPDNPVSTNGTPALIYGFGPLDVTASGGGDFYLDSFLAGITWYSSQTTATISYVLDLSAGGTATGTFDIGQGFQSYSFGALVTKASFTGLSDGYVAIDDVVVDVAPVPEPATWTLMLAGLGAAARRRRARRG